MKNLLKSSLCFLAIVNSIAVYAQWSENASNVYLTNSSKSVGIGTSSPKQKLHVAGDYYGRGHMFLYAYEGDGNSGNAFVQGRDDSGSSNITLVFRSQNSGTLNNAMVIRPNGNVDIATIATSAFKLQVNGSAAKPGGGSWSTLSDARLKKDVKPFTDGLDIIQKINPVWFRYNGELNISSDQQYVGTIAQDLSEIAPYMVEQSKFSKYDSLTKSSVEESYLTADYNALNFILVNAIKEQQKMIEEQQEKISQLEKRLSALENKLTGSNTSRTGTAASAFREENTSIPHLKQGYPNPSQGELIIPYYLPGDSKSADIVIYDYQGKEILNKKLTNKGHSSISISGLKSGLYYYSLISDGQEYGVEKIIVRQ